MSQNSMLELLSVTSNAVKALDRTSSSKSSGSGGGTPGEQWNENVENQPPAVSQDVHDNSKSSADSGVGKTATHSIPTSDRRKRQTHREAHDSDDSTTASDVLIPSTLAEAPGNMNKPSSLNASASSQGSGCIELDNFNVATAKKVKVSKKQLREIVSPRDSFDSQHGQALPTAVAAHKDRSSDERRLNTNNNFTAEKMTGVKHKPENGKVANNLPGKVVQGVTKHFSGSDKSFPGQRKTLNQGLDSSASVYTVERHGGGGKQTTTKDFPPDVEQLGRKSARDTKQSSASGQLPYKVSRHDGPVKEQIFVQPEEPMESEDWDDGCSVTSSQPEILTVTERVVNISSQALMMSDYEDSASQGSAMETVSAANKPQSFPRAKPTGGGLRQGALMQGPAMPKAGKGDEVQISKFSLTGKQREVRDALAKRGGQSKPVKRVVHPKVVHSSASSVSDDGFNKNNNMETDGGGRVGNVESITAAVAASAAVAATQPFLKMQQDMESKMQSLLGEMDRVQKQVQVTGVAGPSTQSDSDSRLHQLEEQVKELTERRLMHLETLQSQQMEVQAQLLSMSRNMSHSYQHPPPTTHSHPTYFSTTSLVQPPGPSKAAYNRALIERELMRGRLQGSKSGGNTKGSGGKSKEVEESVYDTPNPRSKPPRPAEFSGAKGGFLQEILAAEPSPQLNTTFKLPHGHTPPTKISRNRRDDGASPVEKARKLVLDLSNLEDRTAESLWTDLRTSKSRPIIEDPAPLEHYLKRVRDANTTPYSKLGKAHRDRSSSPSKHAAGTSKVLRSTDAPVQDKYRDARSVLQSVVSGRETLEKNLEMMTRTRQDVDVYTLIGGATADRSEAARIQKMVEKRITSLNNEVKREVEWDLQHGVSQTKSTGDLDPGRKSYRGAATKPTVGFGSGAPRMSRIDSGLRKSQSVQDTTSYPGKGKKIIKAKPAPKTSKIRYEDEDAMTQIYGKAGYQRGRTTVKDPYLHYQNQAKPRTSRLPSPKRPDGVLDVRSFQAQTGSTTLMQAGPSVVQAEGGQPRQYFFSPTRGYVPIAPTTTAPVPGQLIPMAVPLGKPRMEPGLSVAPGNQPYPMSVPHASPRLVTAASNVAMVAMTADDYEESVHDRAPQLGKQVLPAVDIDSLSPSSSPRGSDINIGDPDTSRNAGYLQTFHYQDSEEEEGEGDKTLTEYSSDEEHHGTGIALPGYHQPTPARDTAATAKMAAPDRAPRTALLPDRTSQLREQGEVPWEERCDELAEDLRTRDVLQNKAKYWLEQELMARMLMKMYPVMSAQADQQPEVDDVADRSDSIPDDESLLVGDTIGQQGLQLFVNAGVPVNNNLVNALVREVIAQKVGGMLGRKQETDSADAGSRAAQSGARVVGGGRMGVGADADVDEETQFVRPSHREDQRVPTPQPTPPCTSPVPGYLSHHAPATPPLTPPPPPIPPRERSPVKDVSSASSAAAAAMVSAATSITPQLETVPQAAPALVYESETEVSASLDISQELRVLDGKVKPAESFAPYASQSQHDVVTPSSTPPPVASPPPTSTQQHRTTTPPPSPPPPAKTAPPGQEELVVARERVGQAKSPQPWGNPDSPGPQLNPTFEEAADTRHPQPRPLMMSVEVGTETVKEQPRSPSPQRRRSASLDQSELDSLSSPSDATDTFNDNISEGQWLVSRSEGQVAGLPLDNELHRRAAAAARKIDTSTASTLRDTDDLDLDDTDASRSEGEFLHKGDVLNPETDPVLALLMQGMHHQPGGFRQYDLPPTRVHQVLNGNSTDRSVGEVGRNGQGQGHGYGAVRRSMGDMSEGQVIAGHSAVTVVAPKIASPPTTQDFARSSRRGQGEGRTRSASPVTRRTPNAPRSRTPPAPRRGQQQYQPVRSDVPPSQSRRTLKSALVRSSQDSRHSRDSEPDSERRGPQTEYGTRTLTPDQLNTEALLQSGTYMTRSMNSTGRHGSTKKSVEFDLSGTYESRRESYRGSEDGFSSTGGTSDRLSGSGRSLGLRYSLDDSTSQREGVSSHREGVSSHREGVSSHLKMSVTIPTTEGGSESDVSEIDLSDNTGY
ncbi:TALPID3 protein-like [Littorina saxatilis]|uniref:TALPID3 protein-like n=1 Tax=Littorina saxatilis TaxID=31220 RepID=UPI0038B58CF3